MIWWMTLTSVSAVFLVAMLVSFGLGLLVLAGMPWMAAVLLLAICLVCISGILAAGSYE